jgi:hypothetical protein
MEAIREFITQGLRAKGHKDGEYTSLLVQDVNGRTVFRGAVMVKLLRFTAVCCIGLLIWRNT